MTINDMGLLLKKSNGLTDKRYIMYRATKNSRVLYFTR